MKPSGGIDTEITAGDKNQELNAHVGNNNTTNNKAEQIGDRVETQTNIIQGVPLWAILVMILGWMMPTPSNIAKGIWKGFLILVGKKDDKYRN